MTIPNQPGSLRDDLRQVVSNAANAAVEDYKRKCQSHDQEQGREKYVYGISGLAFLLKVSYPTAIKIKTVRKLPYLKAGRKFIFDIEQVLNILKEDPA